MIFGFGKKRPLTFKARVAKFWEWFPKVSGQILAMIDSKRSQDLPAIVSKPMDDILPGLSWVFGSGEPGGHSFTVTGEGVLARQLLAEYWRSRALSIPRWTFHASRQPAPPDKLKSVAIRLGEHEQVDVETLLLKTTVDEEAKKIHLVAWHPALARVPADHHMQILFLLLDEALGEFGTEMWLGHIQVEPFEGESRPLADLPRFVEHVNGYYRWNKLSPLETYAVYQIPEPMNFRRGDTVVGSTRILSILQGFLENGGSLPDDPLEGTGAELAYLAVDSSVIPQENATEARSEIEQAISAALGADLSGQTLGGAFGVNETYIDLLLFDGDSSRQIIQKTLAQLKLGKLARLEMMAQ